jgi:hypothetical protein
MKDVDPNADRRVIVHPVISTQELISSYPETVHIRDKSWQPFSNPQLADFHLYV